MRIEKGRMALELEEDREDDGRPLVGVYLYDDEVGFGPGHACLSILLTPGEAEVVAEELMALVRRARRRSEGMSEAQDRIDLLNGHRKRLRRLIRAEIAGVAAMLGWLEEAAEGKSRAAPLSWEAIDTLLPRQHEALDRLGQHLRDLLAAREELGEE